jgi:hypothetical protein
MDDAQTETGFGTGLRAHLRGDVEPPPPQAEPEQPHRPDPTLARVEARERVLAEREFALMAEEARIAELAAEFARREPEQPEPEILLQAFKQALQTMLGKEQPAVEDELALARARRAYRRGIA